MGAVSCDDDDGENIVDLFLVGEVGGVNACHYGGCYRTVLHQLAHMFERMRGRGVTISPHDKRDRPMDEGLQSATISSSCATPPRRGGT